jgi:hypothetical protein
MQSKSKALASFLRAGICAIIALGAVAIQAQDQKVDANGTWKWTQPGRNGGADREFSLKLKVDGGKLTGTYTQPGRGGGDPVDTDISNGKIDGNHISFEVVRDTQNGSFTNKFDGKIAGDTITGTQPGGRGGRGRRGGAGGGDNGGMAGGTNAPAGGTDGAPAPRPAPTTRPWTATRSTQ